MDVWGQLRHFYFKYLKTRFLYSVQNIKAEMTI